MISVTTNQMLDVLYARIEQLRRQRDSYALRDRRHILAALMLGFIAGLALGLYL